MRIRQGVKDHALTLALMGLFLAALVGESITGLHAFNADQRAHHEAAVSYGTFVRTGRFGETTFENWESEFLEMGTYVLLTVWLVQRGSAESKAPEEEPFEGEDPRRHRHDPDAPWPVRRGGPVLWLYERSLSIALFTLFGLAWLLHLVTGAHAYNAEQVAHGEATISTWAFAKSAQFWYQSFQNWQSEFLGVVTLVVLSIFLRQRGSPESKAVHVPHSATGG
jgi:hypothetical protein